MVHKGWEPTVKRVHEFVQASMQPQKSTSTSNPTSELNKAGQTITEKVANAVRTGEDNFRIPCRICGKMMHFSSRFSNWEGGARDVLYAAFKNWQHTECMGG